VGPRSVSTEGAALLDESSLQRLPNNKLERVFGSSPAGPMPAGRLRGTALFFPGTPACVPLARLTSC
jgi:hypothetical protein